MIKRETKTQRKMAKTTLNTDVSTLETITRLKKGDWLVIPLGILALLCGNIVVINWSDIWSAMPLTALLVALFSIVHITKTILRLPRNTISKIVAYTLSIFLIGIGIFLMFNSQSGSCSVIGAPSSCSNANFFVFVVLFLNPFTMPFLGFVSAIGILASILPFRKDTFSKR